MPFTRQHTSPRSLLPLSLLSLSPPFSLHSCGSRLTPRVNEAAVPQVKRMEAFYLCLNSLGAISLSLTMFLPLCGFGQTIVSLSISLLINIEYKNQG